jgi:Na+/proline symporter
LQGRIRPLVRFGGLAAIVVGVICLGVGVTMSPRHLVPLSNVPYRDAFMNAGLVLPPIGVVLLVLSYAVPGVRDNRRRVAASPPMDRATSVSDAGPALRRGRKVVIAGWLVGGIAVLYVVFLGWTNPDPQQAFLSPDVLLAILAFLVACAMIVGGTVLMVWTADAGQRPNQQGQRASHRDARCSGVTARSVVALTLANGHRPSSARRVAGSRAPAC